MFDENDRLQNLLWCWILGGVVLGVMIALTPSIIKYVHRNDVHTVDTAKYTLIKKYSGDKDAHYIYKLSWKYSDKKEYADTRYVAKATSNHSHTYKRVGISYSNTEPVPDKLSTYKLDDVQKDREQRERDSSPTVIPFFIPIR